MKATTKKATSTVRARRPFAFWGFWIVIAILIFSAIAFLGASFPTFPWFSIVVITFGLAFLTAIWLWGFYVGFGRIPVIHRAVENTTSDPSTEEDNMEVDNVPEKKVLFVQDPDWENVPASEEA